MGTNLFANLLARVVFEQEKPNPAEIESLWIKELSSNALSEKQISELVNVTINFLEHIKDEITNELSNYTHEIEVNPNAVAYFNRGQFFLGMENYSAALSDFEHAMRLDPNYASAIEYKNKILRKQAEIKTVTLQKSVDLANREYLSKVQFIEQMKVNMELKNNLLADLYLDHFGTIRPVDNLKSVIIFNNDLRKSLSNSTFTLVDITASETPDLTPEYLNQIIYPYIQNLADLQNLINEINKKPLGKVVIKSIQQNSPVSVSLDGASDAIQLIKETVVPWRRKHAETMAHLLEQEKLAEIELKKAEVLEKRAIAAKEREFTDKLKVENAKLRAETALQQAKTQLATEIILAITTSLNEAEKEMYIAKLSPALDVLALGRLEMIVDK